MGYLHRVFLATEEVNRRAILSVAEPRRGATLLDLGCGDGAFTERVGRKVQAKRVLGVELFAGAAEAAERRGIEVHRADLGAELPFAAGSIDVVHSNQVIEHLPGTDHFMREIRRVLAPGGYAVLSTNNLASLHNVACLLAGLQPPPCHVSDVQVGVGNPLNAHRGLESEAGQTHLRVFTGRALMELAELHGLRVVSARTAGFYPLPPRPAEGRDADCPALGRLPRPAIRSGVTLIRAKAPLRISFAGGGTDVAPFPEREGGLVLNATINRYAYGTLRPRNDGNLQINSLDYGLSAEFGAHEPLVFDGKLDLAKAAIRRFTGSDSRGFDLLLHSNAPPGSGLGASSAMIVALIGVLKEFQGLPVTDYELAELAVSIERDELGIHGGRQDQYAATFGGFNFIEFAGDHVVVNPLRVAPDVMLELEHNLLLCYTGMTRQSDHIIEDQTARYEEHDKDAVAGLHAQKELAIEMKNALLQHRLRDFGDLLHTAWEAKKRMSARISNDRIDELYLAARAAGALGGKVTGAGGGGYILLYCRYDLKHKVAERMIELGATVDEFAFEPNGLRTWRVDDD